MAKTTNQQYTLRATGMLQAGRDIAYNQLITSLDSFLQRVNTNIWNVPGSSTGNANIAYIEFDDSAGTRKGYVGDANGSNQDIYLVADVGGLILGAGNNGIVGMDTVKLFPITTSATDLGGVSNTWQHVFAEGIQFPASQVASGDANNLDDYEEGTFTVSITFATPGNLSVVYSTRVGNYTKIGRMCKVSMLVETSTFTHTTAAGQLKFTGLPFSDSVTTAGLLALTSGLVTGADTQIACLTFGTEMLFYFTNNATGTLNLLTITQATSGVNKLIYAQGIYNA